MRAATPMPEKLVSQSRCFHLHSLDRQESELVAGQEQGMMSIVLLKRRLRSFMRHHYKTIKISVLLIIIVVFSKVIRRSYSKPGPPQKCKNSEEEIDRLVQITYKVHAILESMGIDCWLMYCSIWGPLRGIEGPLPWDEDVDLAIDGDGQFSRMTFGEFKALFIVLGLSVENRMWQSSLI